MRSPSGGEAVRSHRASLTALAPCSLPTPLGPLPALTCTDSCYAYPTPYHEPRAAQLLQGLVSSLRPSLSRMRGPDQIATAKSSHL